MTEDKKYQLDELTVTDILSYLGARVSTKEKQLTKAKEIISDLLSDLYSVEYDRVSDLEEAEQFLQKVEV